MLVEQGLRCQILCIFTLSGLFLHYDCILGIYNDLHGILPIQIGILPSGQTHFGTIYMDQCYTLMISLLDYGLQKGVSPHKRML